MALALSCCFAIPAVLALYAALFSKEKIRGIPLFFLFAFASVIAASVVRAITEPFALKLALSLGGIAPLFFRAFVQAALIEEASKAAFFFLALKKAFPENSKASGVAKDAVFYFALFFGAIFASLETLSVLFYHPESLATRMPTAHVIHPAAILLSALGLFLSKIPLAACLALAVMVHGFYNVIASLFSFETLLFYTAATLLLAFALWLKALR